MFNSDRRILVIGGAGYIGSTLVRVLLEKGASVRVLDNLLYGNGGAIADLSETPRFDFIRGDFCDRLILERSLNGVSDVILLAALVGDPLCKKYPDEARRINDAGTIALIDSLKGLKLNRFVFMSTCSNYGLREDNTPADENSPLKPLSLYAETKVKVEKYILNNLSSFDFAPVVLRCATAFGISPRMRFDLTVSEFTRQLALGREMVVYDENTWRPYCHIRDIGEAITAVLEAPREKIAGEIFNVGSNRANFTKKMLVDLILQRFPQGKVQYQKGGRDARNYRVNFDKIAVSLNFKAGHDIPAAIDSLADAINNGLYDDVEPRHHYYGNYTLESNS